MTHCPFLQEQEGSAVSQTHAAQGGLCLAQHPPSEPSLPIKARLCECSAHVECLYHQRASHAQDAPPEPDPGEGLSRAGGRARRVSAWSLLVVLVLAGLFVIWHRLGPNSKGPGPLAAEPTSLATAAPAASTTYPSPPPSATALRVPTPEPPAGPSATPRPRAFTAPYRIRIPKINVDAEVVQVAYKMQQENGQTVTVWQVADYAAGFQLGSAFPGDSGNMVIAAHNNIRGRVFRYLVDLVPGDDVYLSVEGQEYRYAVAQRLLVKEKGMPEEIRRENAQWIEPTSDERLTLVSCWPFVKPDYRVVVIAKPWGQ